MLVEAEEEEVERVAGEPGLAGVTVVVGTMTVGLELLAACAA